MSVTLQMSSNRIVAVPAASRGSSTSKKKKKEKKKKDLRQASSSSTSTSTDRSSVIIHEKGGDDELPEDFVKEYSLDLDQLGPSPRLTSESSSESKSDSEDDDRNGRRKKKKKKQKSKPFTRPRVLTSSAEAISTPIISEEEGGSGSDFSGLYNHHLTNNGLNRVAVRRTGSSLSTTRTSVQPPPLAALSKELFLRVRSPSPPLPSF